MMDASTIKQDRNPVSRVDSNRTHGYFARVYRADWVGSRSFADRRYGGPEAAERAANKWVKIADERLPVIPPKPVRKTATVHVRADAKGEGLRYYDVYLPSVIDESWTTEKFYFKDLDEQARSRERAYRRVENQNQALWSAYMQTLSAWQIVRRRSMEEILKLWAEIKTMTI